MTTHHVAPAQARELIDQGAILIDIREADEHAREHIGAARHLALSAIDRWPQLSAGTVIFHCRSGNRTQVNASRLAAAAPGARVLVLDGGLEAWRDAGLPTQQDRRQPIEIMRQVQIAVGLLVLLGVGLGTLVHPGFLAIAGVMGAGLTFAGVSGFCGMANLLALAPWNKAAPRVSAA